MEIVFVGDLRPSEFVRLYINKRISPEYAIIVSMDHNNLNDK